MTSWTLFVCPGWSPLAELECSPGGFRAEGRTVLDEAQYPRVKASRGFYCSGFIHPTNKQTNKVDMSTYGKIEGVWFRKKESKPSDFTCKQSEPVRTISKIQKKKLFENCAMNNARIILLKGSTPLRICWFWSKKLHFERILIDIS